MVCLSCLVSALHRAAVPLCAATAPMYVHTNRLVTVFPQLRRLVETMSTVAAMLLKIMVLYSCVSYTFAAVGMAIFADAKSDLLEPRWVLYLRGCWRPHHDLRHELGWGVPYFVVVA